MDHDIANDYENEDELKNNKPEDESVDYSNFSTSSNASSGVGYFICDACHGQIKNSSINALNIVQQWTILISALCVLITFFIMNMVILLLLL